MEGKDVTIICIYLSNHDREGKDSNKIVDELEDNLKQGGGVRQTTNGDQGLHRKVVTTNVAEQRQRQEALERDVTGRSFFFTYLNSCAPINHL